MVEVLQELIHRNSQNSSQPPSQDRPEQKPTREPSRPPRKREGQPGHAGHHRTLVEDVDEVVVYKPIRYEQCGALLLGEDLAPYRHPVTELPIVQPQVTEYQVHRLTCLGCGYSNRGELPPAIAASWFGPNVISLAGYVMGRFRLSKRQAADRWPNASRSQWRSVRSSTSSRPQRGAGRAGGGVGTGGEECTGVQC